MGPDEKLGVQQRCWMREGSTGPHYCRVRCVKEAPVKFRLKQCQQEGRERTVAGCAAEAHASQCC